MLIEENNWDDERGITMADSKLVPGLWGILENKKTQTRTEIEALAREILDQMSLDEKIAHMSGDTPLFPGSIQMLYGYNLKPLPTGKQLEWYITTPRGPSLKRIPGMPKRRFSPAGRGFKL